MIVSELEWSGPVQVASGGCWRVCRLCGTTIGKESSLCVGYLPSLMPPVDALHRAAEEGNLSLVRELVLKGSLVDGFLDGKTPWMLADRAGHSRISYFLLAQGASRFRRLYPPPGAFDGRCICGGVRFRIHSGPLSKNASDTTLQGAERYLWVPQERLELLKGTRLIQDAGGPNGALHRQCRRCHCTVSVETAENPDISYVLMRQLDDPRPLRRSSRPD